MVDYYGLMQLKCCGHDSYTDWFGIEWSEQHKDDTVPDSCCINSKCNNTVSADGNGTVPDYTDVSQQKMLHTFINLYCKCKLYLMSYPFF